MLIAAIIAANLIGILGVIIAAPLLATLQLIGRYTMRKMLDEDPWPASEERLPPLPMSRPLQRLRKWLAKPPMVAKKGVGSGKDQIHWKECFRLVAWTFDLVLILSLPPNTGESVFFKMQFKQ